MIHDMPTVNAIRSAGSRIQVSDESIAWSVGGIALTEARRRSSRALESAIAERYPLFVVDPLDFEWRMLEHDTTTLVRTFVTRWVPQTKVVELVGGRCDGTVIEIPRPGDPFCAAVPDVPISVGDYRTEPDAFMPPPAVVLYKLDGWNDLERRWVYRTDGIAR